mgnify:CR=1 FL=1
MMTCEVCGKLYISKSLKRESNMNFRRCDECYYSNKAQTSLASANRKAQTEFMRLERRIEKLEKKKWKLLKQRISRGKVAAKKMLVITR